MTKSVKPTASHIKQQQENEAAMVVEAKRDLAKFGLLYEHYVQPLYRYLVSRIGHQQGAEDVTAQTFLAALEKFPGYRHQGKFGAWLYSIARSKTADYFRDHKKQAALEIVDPASDHADPLRDIIKSERIIEMTKLIAQLSEDERELIRLRYVAELRFGEISALVGRKEDAVKKSLYRLLARLQSQLEEYYE